MQGSSVIVALAVACLVTVGIVRIVWTPAVSMPPAPLHTPPPLLDLKYTPSVATQGPRQSGDVLGTVLLDQWTFNPALPPKPERLLSGDEMISIARQRASMPTTSALLRRTTRKGRIKDLLGYSVRSVPVLWFRDLLCCTPPSENNSWQLLVVNDTSTVFRLPQYARPDIRAIHCAMQGKWVYACPPKAGTPFYAPTVTMAVLNGVASTNFARSQLFGITFNKDRVFHFPYFDDKIPGPLPIPDDFAATIHHYPALINGMGGIYYEANGHFATQNFPRFLHLLLYAPADVPILVRWEGLAAKFFEYLAVAGLLNTDRIIRYPATHHEFFSADVMFLSNGEAETPIGLEVMRRFMRSTFPDQWRFRPRNKIVVVNRQSGSRAISNHQDLVAMIRRTRPEYTLVEHLPSASLQGSMEMFAQAALIVAPHGAGLFNMHFSDPGTPVIEIGYDKGYPWPSMFWRQGASTGHPYWPILCSGSYMGPIKADIEAVRVTVIAALKA